VADETPPEIELSTGKTKMDVPDDRTEIIMAESAGSFQSLIHEELANQQSSSNIARHSGVRKYDGEDPLEAMAAAKILKMPAS